MASKLDFTELAEFVQEKLADKISEMVIKSILFITFRLFNMQYYINYLVIKNYILLVLLLTFNNSPITFSLIYGLENNN